MQRSTISTVPTLEQLLEGFCPHRHGEEVMAWERVGREIHEHSTTPVVTSGRGISTDGPTRE